MRVRIKIRKRFEVGGVLQNFPAESTVDVGNGTARKWIAAGEAEPIERLPQGGASDLVVRARAFWFKNTPGLFDGEISREQIFTYGGPDPAFNDCPICQRAEWLARVTQTPEPAPEHDCNVSFACNQIIQKQGDDRWTHFHQNFMFAAYVDQGLKAPKCLMIQPPKGYKFLTEKSCDQSVAVFLRQFAYACQFDIIKQGGMASPNDYDFCFFVNNGVDPVPVKPAGIPSIMYCHDLWKRRQERQAAINAWLPDIIWTPFKASWEKHYKIPKGTKVIFRPIPASMFFTRPNLKDKDCDLLVIGAAGMGIYEPRAHLSQFVLPLKKEFNVRIHNAAGARRSRWTGANDADKIPYANAWSDFIGRARYVIFAGIAEEPQPVFFKFYEALGSGAIPIMPTAPDLKNLGINAWEHYLPLEHYKTLADLRGALSDYDSNYRIAENAVDWFRANADTMLFNGFEDMAHGLIPDKYQKRIV